MFADVTVDTVPTLLTAQEALVAVGGVTGLIAGLTTALRIIFRLDGPHGTGAAFAVAFAVAFILTLAQSHPQVAAVVDPTIVGAAYGVLVTGVHKILTLPTPSERAPRWDATSELPTLPPTPPTPKD